MFYREIAPSAELENLILNFWEFVVPDDAPSPIAHEIFPDGCVSVFYYRNLLNGVSRAGVTQLYTESTTRYVSAGDMLWGLRISPAACSLVLKIDPTVLHQHRPFSGDEVPHLTRCLAESLSPVGSLEEAIPVFETHLKGLVDTPEEYDQFVAATIRIINRQQGEIKIEDLARMLGISTRQLQRRFRRSAGLSPKQFARIRRVRAAATPLVEGKSVNWAERALESGFSDQSHLSNEFTAITKRSPSSFARKIRKITHGSLTK